MTEYENIEYETSDDDVGPDQLPDIITDAMQDLSLGEHALTRFHGKSSSVYSSIFGGQTLISLRPLDGRLDARPRSIRP